MKRKTVKNSGFTLIELLVALAIFSVVITAAADIFIAGLGGTRRLFGSQAVQESGRFIMESMSKEIRMSTINSLDEIPLVNLDSVGDTSYTVLELTNENGNFKYIFDNASKQVNRIQVGGPGDILNSAKVEATGAFYLVKNGDTQPRIVITLGLVNKSTKVSQQAAIHLQTTVSSREYAQ